MAQTTYAQREQALGDVLTKALQGKALLDTAKATLDQAKAACDPTLFPGGTQTCLAEIASDAGLNPSDAAAQDQQNRASKLVTECQQRAAYCAAFAALRDVALSVDLSAGLTDSSKAALKTALVNAGMIPA